MGSSSSMQAGNGGRYKRTQWKGGRQVVGMKGRQGGEGQAGRHTGTMAMPAMPMAMQRHGKGRAGGGGRQALSLQAEFWEG